MQYYSTRGKSEAVSAAQAIVNGIAKDGGLYVPDSFPPLEETDYTLSMPYAQRAAKIMGKYMPEFVGLEEIAERSYASFRNTKIAPVTAASDGTYYLELWHGPTCAFKDMALQILPRLMKKAMKITGEKRKVCIITATSGDTGKAALEGFKDVEDISIYVFYPKDGVSEIQRLQMVTQEGGNVGVWGINGNFDDAQNGVKTLFADAQLNEELDRNNICLSAANSINIGRLLPQIVYYCDAYAQMIGLNAIKKGEKLNFCVPTGNFGNILAALYAKRMGLPVGKLICASNKNDVLTQLLSEGVYNRNRKFYTTISPSMDILVSSNFERALYHYTSPEYVLYAMEKLGADGVYVLPIEILSAIKEDFLAGFCDDSRTMDVISRVYRETGVLIDPHTAVARAVYDDVRNDLPGQTVIVSTASAFKFPEAVCMALTGKRDSSFVGLSSYTGMPVPSPLANLGLVRFNVDIEPCQMRGTLIETLNVGSSQA